MDSMVARARTAPPIVYGPFALDPEGWNVTLNGGIVPLTASEFILLRELVLQSGRVLTREALEQALQETPTCNRQGHRELSGRSIDLLVSRLRRKLLRAGCDWIRTMRYVGYQFVPE
jgi:DNA-binding response OmpR family regulator